MMLIIGACFYDQEIIIKNDSTADAWISTESGSERYIRPQGSIRLAVSSPGIVNLRYWGRHILPGNIMVETEGSGSRHVSLQPNCGALRLHNSGSLEIRALQIAPASTYDWSANLLDRDLRTGEHEFFSLSPGYYDLRIRDRHNNYFYVTALSIKLDITSNHIFSGSQKAGSASDPDVLYDASGKIPLDS